MQQPVLFGTVEPLLLRRVSRRHTRRSQPVQTDADQSYSRQRQKDIRNEGEMDAGQEVAPKGHYGTEDRDADGDRDPLTRSYKAAGESFVGIWNIRRGGNGRGDDGRDVAEKTAE